METPQLARTSRRSTACSAPPRGATGTRKLRRALEPYLGLDEEDHRTLLERLAREFQWGRYRDRELKKLGIDILRFTWWDVTRSPAVVVRDTRAVLGLR